MGRRTGERKEQVLALTDQAGAFHVIVSEPSQLCTINRFAISDESENLSGSTWRLSNSAVTMMGT